MKYLKQYLEHNKYNGSYEIGDWVWVNAGGQKLACVIVNVDDTEISSSYWYKIKYIDDSDGISYQSVTGDKLELMTKNEIKTLKIKMESEKYNL